MLDKSIVGKLLPKIQALFPKWMQGHAAIGRAYSTNDRIDVSDTLREAELKQIFEAHGDEIEFVD